MKKVLAIDPGNKGALILFDGKKLKHWAMPTNRDGEVDFEWAHNILSGVADHHCGVTVYLERAVSFGMGTRSAFNYGRGFAAVEIAIFLTKLPAVYVEPAKWTKVMHQGIAKELKPKAKSQIAVRRLFPHLVDRLPRNKKGELLDGPVDALLIAAYGLKQDAPGKDFDFS